MLRVFFGEKSKNEYKLILVAFILTFLIFSLGVYFDSDNGFKDNGVTKKEKKKGFNLNNFSSWEAPCNMSDIDISENGEVYFIGDIGILQDKKFCLGKFDSEGDLQWVKSLESSGIWSRGTAIHLAENESNVYTVKAVEGENVDYTYVEKFSEDGELLWKKEVFSGGTSKALEVADGNIYVGEISGNGGLVKINSSGDVLKERYLPAVEDIKASKDQKLYVSGNTSKSFGESSWYLSRLNNNLENDWTNYYNPKASSSDAFRGLLEINQPENTVYLLGTEGRSDGSSDYDRVLIKTDLQGDKQDKILIDDGNGSGQLSDTALGPNGNLYYTGWKLSLPVKIDSAGNILWQKSLEASDWTGIEVYEGNLYLADGSKIKVLPFRSEE
ncbi:MAG: hypothetical protein ABEI53_00560 [Candidatus Magasanikbacteria bacterium]